CPAFGSLFGFCDGWRFRGGQSPAGRVNVAGSPLPTLYAIFIPTLLKNPTVCARLQGDNRPALAMHPSPGPSKPVFLSQLHGHFHSGDSQNESFFLLLAPAGVARSEH